MANYGPSPALAPSADLIIMSSRKRPREQSTDVPIKRQQTEELRIMSRASVATSCGVPRAEREQFFDALESADQFPGNKRPIDSAEDLEKAELRACFALLHACGTATDVTATLATTRQSVESFLEAIFNNWRSDAAEQTKPELADACVSADVVAGRVCMAQDHHENISQCLASNICITEISATATYTTCPAMLQLEYTKLESSADQSQRSTICPLTRSDIQWVTSDWAKVLQQTLHTKILGRMHSYNKRLAIWEARQLIHGWANGILSTDVNAANIGFLKAAAAKSVLFDFTSMQ